MNNNEEKYKQFIEAIKPYNDELTKLYSLKMPMAIMNLETGHIDITYNDASIHRHEEYLRKEIENIRIKFNIPSDGPMPEKWEWRG